MEAWYALYTKPNAEAQVARILQGRGLEAFLPLLPARRDHRLEPLFPTYLFIRCDLETLAAHNVQWIRGLRYILRLAGQPVIVPDAVIAHLQKRVAEIEAQGGLPTHSFRPGDAVYVREGPFAGLDAVFEGPLGPAERVRILIHFLGHENPAEVPAAWLRKTSERPVGQRRTRHARPRPAHPLSRWSHDAGPGRRMTSLMPAWRRTLYVIWFTQFIAVGGFSFIMPFIPYYVQELGITGVKEVALWSGVVTSAQAVSMAIMAPIWGALADRYGRKLMLLRACYAGAIVMTLMGFVTNVQQLVVLRFIQGLLTGTVAASTALAAGVVPKERSGMALGSLQMAFFLGVSLGPLLGGLSGDTVGYRPSFWVTGSLLLLSGILVTFLVHEDFHPSQAAATGGLKQYGRSFKVALASTALVAAFAARILLRAGSRSLDPILPLFVQSLLPGAGHMGSIAGAVAAVSALGAAIGAPVIGNWGDRLGHRRLLIAEQPGGSLRLYPPGVRYRSGLADRLATGERLCGRRHAFDPDRADGAARHRRA